MRPRVYQAISLPGPLECLPLVLAERRVSVSNQSLRIREPLEPRDGDVPDEPRQVVGATPYRFLVVSKLEAIPRRLTVPTIGGAQTVECRSIE
jgi:hypothetical protein